MDDLNLIRKIIKFKIFSTERIFVFFKIIFDRFVIENNYVL